MAERNDKGQFIKGHPYLPAQNGKQNGRKKCLTTQVKDALKLAEDAMPDILKVMIARAEDRNDRDSQRAAEYLMDRIYGRPPLKLQGDKDQPIFPAILEIVIRGRDADSNPT